MSGLLIGYARVSTEEQDLTAQRDGLAALGVEPSRIYVDHGLTGTNRERPGLREALAACRGGDTLVVTKLDRLARSLPDARGIAEDLTKRKVRLSLGASVYDPTDPVGRLLFNVLAMVAEQLRAHGVAAAGRDPVDHFVAAALAGDAGTVETTAPSVVAAARKARPGLIVWAASSQRIEAVGLLAAAGFDINAYARRPAR